MSHAHARIVRPQDLPAAASPPASAGTFPVPPSVPAPGPAASPAGPAPLAGQVVSSLASPQAAAAAAGAVMAAAQTPFPSEAPGIYDSLVRLPGGLNLGSGQYAWTAEVRELTGADEERMARAGQSGNMYHYLETLLACGTVKLGDGSPADTARLLPKLLVGDRDMIALAIRVATYGPEYEVLDYACPACGGVTARITCSLLPEPAGDIGMRTLSHPDDASFEVPLRHGGTALVRLPNGEDQKYLADFLKVTVTERNSAMLRRCVTRVTEPSGIVRDVAAEPSVILSMPAADRKAILKEITERQPGPQLLQGVRFTHIDCGKEVVLPVTLASLFLG
jgi:hypothetical protein